MTKVSPENLQIGKMYAMYVDGSRGLGTYNKYLKIFIVLEAGDDTFHADIISEAI